MLPWFVFEPLPVLVLPPVLLLLLLPPSGFVLLESLPVLVLLLSSPVDGVSGSVPVLLLSPVLSLGVSVLSEGVSSGVGSVVGFSTLFGVSLGDGFGDGSSTLACVDEGPSLSSG